MGIRFENEARMNDCIFCKVVSGEAHSWKVYETDAAYAFLDINPVNPYHTLVIPKNHHVNIFDIPENELLGVVSCLKHVINLYKEKLGLENAQVVSSSGAIAQQDVFHLHFHIVPRHKKDGQNIKWNTHPEMRPEFDKMLRKLL